MSIAIHNVELGRDKALLIEFLRFNLTPLSDEKRFDWLYCRGPAGPAEAWMALDERHGKLVGVGAAFPRRFRIGCDTLLCQVLGDFCVDAAHRSLGPALQLQRRCLEAARSGRVPFCYDFPSEPMMAIYKRLGVAAMGRVVRFVKPLKVNRKVQGLIGKGALANGVSALGNRLLALQESWQYAKKSCELSLHSGSFGEEFTELDRRLSGCYPVCLSRTAEYLNWRYHENPLASYQALTARRAGELLGFAVVGIEGQDGLLVDFFADLQAPQASELLSGVVELGHQTSLQAISAPALEDGGLGVLLSRNGFHAREAAPMVAYGQTGSRFAELMTKPGNWWVTHGDRDV